MEPVVFVTVSAPTRHPSLIPSEDEVQEANGVKIEPESIPFENRDFNQQEAPDTSRLGDVCKTIFRWKRSIYRAVWKTMLGFYILYVSISCIYIFALDANGQKIFNEISEYFSNTCSNLNITIMLGFFTSRALQRLFKASNNVPGTATITTTFIASLKPESSRFRNGKHLVKDYARWVLLCWVLTARYVSKPFRERDGPSDQDLVKAGILTSVESDNLSKEELRFKNQPLVVIRWMLLLLDECAQNDHFRKDNCHQKNVEMLMKFKKNCGNMINKFAKRNMPLGLVQAAIIVVYYCGLASLLIRHDKMISPDVIGGDAITSSSYPVQLHNLTTRQIMIQFFPISALMQFFVFYAWLALGRMAVTPFGEYESDISLKKLYECHRLDYKWLIECYSSKEKLANIFPSVNHFKAKKKKVSLIARWTNKKR